MGALAVNADRRLLKQLAVAIAAVTLVVAVGLVTTGEAVTSKPLVAVQVDEFSVFPGTQGAPRGKVRFVVFPGSRRDAQPVWPRTQESIDKQARNLLAQIGGEEVIRGCE